jgi:hypothetical protein
VGNDHGPERFSVYFNTLREWRRAMPGGSRIGGCPNGGNKMLLGIIIGLFLIASLIAWALCRISTISEEREAIQRALDRIQKKKEQGKVA